MAVTSLSDDASESGASAAFAELDAGASNAVLKIYGGTEPSDVSVAITTEPLLSTHAMSDPAMNAPTSTGGVTTISADTIGDDSDADGHATEDATFFRLEDSDGNEHVQGDVGLEGSDANLELGSLRILPGARVSVSALSFTRPQKVTTA